jgi:hypothetical protein
MILLGNVGKEINGNVSQCSSSLYFYHKKKAYILDMNWPAAGYVKNDMHFGHSLLGQMLLLLGGDIEINPVDRGPSCGIYILKTGKTYGNQACNVVNVMGYFTSSVVKFQANTNSLLVLTTFGFAVCPQCNHSLIKYTWFGNSLTAQYIVLVYAKSGSVLVTCVLYFIVNNQ